MRGVIRRMICESGVESELAQAIKRFEGWELSDDAARHRIMQTLRPDSRRHFSSDWLPILARFVAYRGGEDLVSAQLSESWYEGRRLREEGRVLEGFERRPPMAKVPAGRARKRGVA